METYALAGTPSELGATFAAAIQERNHSLASITPESVDPPEPKVAFARECVPLVEEHVPELLAEVDAVADGLGVDRETARLVALALDADAGCSLVGIAPEHAACSGPLFGRNLDFHPSTRSFAKRYRTDPADCQRHRTLTEWAGAHRGSIDLDELQTAMGDPDAGACWRIDDEGDDPGSTLWSWTAAPGEDVAHLARDSPATTPYEPVTIPPATD